MCSREKFPTAISSATFFFVLFHTIVLNFFFSFVTFKKVFNPKSQPSLIDTLLEILKLFFQLVFALALPSSMFRVVVKSEEYTQRVSRNENKDEKTRT